MKLLHLYVIIKQHLDLDFAVKHLGYPTWAYFYLISLHLQAQGSILMYVMIASQLAIVNTYRITKTLKIYNIINA